MVCAAILLTLSPMPAQGGSQYQNRGDRYEGVEYSVGVSFVPVTLVSAMIQNPEFKQPWRATVDLAFAPPKGFKEGRDFVTPIVMERRPVLYYRMDKAHVADAPSRPWRVFSWPSKDVLAQTVLKPKDIGAVVRVNQTRASSSEEVCPVVMYFGRPPRKAGKYVFDFIASGSFKGTYKLLDQARGKVIASGKTDGQFENDLTEIVVPAPKVEGWYQLRVAALSSFGAEQGNYSVRFYHYTSLPHGS